MGSQGVTFPRGICMLIEGTGNPGTASRSQMKEVLKVEERGGSALRGPAVEATLSWPVWMAAGLGFPPAAFTKKWFGEEQRDCVYSPARAQLPGPCARCPAQRIWTQEALLTGNSLNEWRITSPPPTPHSHTFSPDVYEPLKLQSPHPRPGQLLSSDKNMAKKKCLPSAFLLSSCLNLKTCAELHDLTGHVSSLNCG